MRNEIKLSSYAKINLSIDVGSVAADGMHPVDMIMQQLLFHDDVTVWFAENPELTEPEIKLTTNKPFLPTDERNLAYRAAQLISEYAIENELKDRDSLRGTIHIDINKKIPVAAGLAGGSGNAAAVLHALNTIWNLKLSLKQLCSLGEKMGSDIPFCLVGQARANYLLPKKIRKDSMATSCARATGTGTRLQPLKPLRRAIVIAKPPISVSTKEVYMGIDSCDIKERPDNDRLAKGLCGGKEALVFENMINVLENYTLSAYEEVGALKEFMSGLEESREVLMSGSGPTVFGIYDSMDDAKSACEKIRKKGYEAYWTKTTK